MEEHGPEALRALLSGIGDHLGSAIDTLSRADGPREQALRQLRDATVQLRRAGDVAERIAPALTDATRKDLPLLVHDMRAPLTAILGWAQLLRGHGEDEALTLRAIETIERNGKILVGMLDDVERTGSSRSGAERQTRPVAKAAARQVESGVRAGPSRERRDRPRPPLDAPAVGEHAAPLGRRRLGAQP
jgi:signal transduction histidine kinase